MPLQSVAAVHAGADATDDDELPLGTGSAGGVGCADPASGDEPGDDEERGGDLHHGEVTACVA